MKVWMRNLFAAAVVAGFVAPALAAAPVPEITAASANVDPLWPAKTQQVMKLNIKQIIESDIVKKYALAQIKQFLEGNDAKSMMTALGLDPLKDIETLSAGFWNEDPNDPKSIQGLAILRGKFDPAKFLAAIETAVQKNGSKMSIVKDGEVTFVKIVTELLPEPVYATMADKNTILIGSDKKLVLEAIKAADNKSKPAIKEDLAELVKTMDEKASLFFCAISSGKIGDLPPQLGQVFDDLDKVKKQLEQVVSSSFTLRVTGDVAMDFTMLMKDPASATDLGGTAKDVLDKFMPFLPFIAQSKPEFKPLLDDVKKTLKTDVKDKNVKLVMKITGSAIGQAVGTDD